MLLLILVCISSPSVALCYISIMMFTCSDKLTSRKFCRESSHTKTQCIHMLRYCLSQSSEVKWWFFYLFYFIFNACMYQDKDSPRCVYLICTAIRHYYCMPSLSQWYIKKLLLRKDYIFKVLYITYLLCFEIFKGDTLTTYAVILNFLLTGDDMIC